MINTLKKTLKLTLFSLFSFECKLKKGGPKVYGVLNIHTTYNVTGSSIETYHFKVTFVCT